MTYVAALTCTSSESFTLADSMTSGSWDGRMGLATARNVLEAGSPRSCGTARRSAASARRRGRDGGADPRGSPAGDRRDHGLGRGSRASGAARGGLLEKLARGRDRAGDEHDRPRGCHRARRREPPVATSVPWTPLSGKRVGGRGSVALRMVGGDRERMSRATPLLDAMTRAMCSGPVRAGAAMKIGVNAMIAVTKSRRETLASRSGSGSGESRRTTSWQVGCSVTVRCCTSGGRSSIPRRSRSRSRPLSSGRRLAARELAARLGVRIPAVMAAGRAR